VRQSCHEADLEPGFNLWNFCVFHPKKLALGGLFHLCDSHGHSTSTIAGRETK
jgi:hypothetical protein